MSDRVFLRHMLATLAYRAGKALRGAPHDFGSFAVAPGSRTPGQILAHMGDLFEWALAISEGRQHRHESFERPWEQEMARFFSTLEAFDAYLATDGALGLPAERLLQGPIADALTHTGQLTMLRRLAGSPIQAESYVQANIVVGGIAAAHD